MVIFIASLWSVFKNLQPNFFVMLFLSISIAINIIDRAYGISWSGVAIDDAPRYILTFTTINLSAENIFNYQSFNDFLGNEPIFYLLTATIFFLFENNILIYVIFCVFAPIFLINFSLWRLRSHFFIGCLILYIFFIDTIHTLMHLWRLSFALAFSALMFSYLHSQKTKIGYLNGLIAVTTHISVLPLFFLALIRRFLDFKDLSLKSKAVYFTIVLLLFSFVTFNFFNYLADIGITNLINYASDTSVFFQTSGRTLISLFLVGFLLLAVKKKWDFFAASSIFLLFLLPYFVNNLPVIYTRVLAITYPLVAYLYLSNFQNLSHLTRKFILGFGAIITLYTFLYGNISFFIHLSNNMFYSLYNGLAYSFMYFKPTFF